MHRHSKHFIGTGAKALALSFCLSSFCLATHLGPRD
jgi:hypothetical protein